ncbi:probable receptor-like protein kinase At1g80640 [Actinidia eriantha]|uniref:probable receptor-like protein kinase At1g80640 n=1 Tax=Actinidia eriantha TaxID=165200 RepID=UPI002588FC52|nr:probable receptor-like protein kinase At1g80640 [Actinidia eriantha]
MNPRKLEDKIEKKREDYQCTLHPFYRRCKKYKVKLEVKLAVGFDRNITIEEAEKCNPRWIVLDSHLKEDKLYISRHVVCNVAVMKRNGVATLMSGRGSEREEIDDYLAFTASEHDVPENDYINDLPNTAVIPAPAQSPCWYPLSWRTGFPRDFSVSELEVMTNGFADENLVKVDSRTKTYRGSFQETPVLVKRFAANDHQFWSVLKILSHVRHRSILNLVGYCCTDASGFLLCDYPCSGTIEMNLLCDESAKSLSWRIRWYIALEIGSSLRYLHEECVDGPVVDLSICSSSVVLSHGSSAMLSIFNTARWLKGDIPGNEDSPPAECLNAEDDKHLLADVRDYGVFLIELITGKSSCYFQEQDQCQSLIDWAMPFLENGSLNQVMDPRLLDTNDAEVVTHMARAALLCLEKDDTDHKLSISEILAVVRGDQFAMATGW